MFILPRLRASGWRDEYIREQLHITAGRIVPQGRTGKRLSPKRADYVLFYAPNFKIAVVEAKSIYETPGHGMQQAIEYAKMLDLRFAYSTNGKSIEEYDFVTRKQSTIDGFPSPDDLWIRLNRDLNFDEKQKRTLLHPFNRDSKSPEGKIIEPRYYQEIAINAAVTSILRGKRRLLLALATGTGKREQRNSNGLMLLRK